MDAMAVETFVDQVAADAERTVGADVEPDLLEHYAREAVLDRWLTRARVTVYVADLALREVREEIERRTAARTALRRAA